MIERVVPFFAAVTLALALIAPAAAQEFPTKPVRIVVPFPPGGVSDILARTLGEKLSAAWKQPVIVENRPGAGGAVGTDSVAKAPADGYTLLVADASAVTANPALYPALPYAARDLVPVISLATFGQILVAPMASPLQSIQDLLAMDKARAARLNVASSGNGTSNHLLLEKFKQAAKLDLAHVPYKGAGPAINDVVGGQVDLMFTSGPLAQPLMAGGKLKALAVSSSKRMPVAPQAPTLAESGLHRLRMAFRPGHVRSRRARRRTSCAKINADVAAAIRLPDDPGALREDGHRRGRQLARAVRRLGGEGNGRHRGADPRRRHQGRIGAMGDAMDTRPAARPNVVLIVADDMGYGDLGALNPAVRTPNLDALVAQGVDTAPALHRLADLRTSTRRAAHRPLSRIAPAPSPSTRSMALTASRCARSPSPTCSAPPATRPDSSASGTTAPSIRASSPTRAAIAEFVGFCGGWSDYYDYTLRVNDSYRRSDGGYLTDVLTDEAIGFVDRHREAPFFLQLAYSAPHSPFQAPQAVIEPYRAQGHNRVVATTYAMIELMDRGIGRLLQQLDDLRLSERTIVLFTSDNGPAFFNPPYMLEPGEATTNERFNCGLRGAKGYIYEGGIRVPMIVRLPGRVPAGTFNDQLVHFVDWLPTLLAMTGVPRLPGPAFDGRDVSAELLAQRMEESPRQFWQWNFYVPYVGTNAAVRDDNWKLVRPMIAGTRFFTKDLYANEEEEAKMRAFVAADLLHKKDPDRSSGTCCRYRASACRRRSRRNSTTSHPTPSSESTSRTPTRSGSRACSAPWRPGSRTWRLNG